MCSISEEGCYLGSEWYTCMMLEYAEKGNLLEIQKVCNIMLDFQFYDLDYECIFEAEKLQTHINIIIIIA